jgi:hypothetical protein
MYSQKLLLPDYSCAKIWVALQLKRDQQPAAAAPRRRPPQAGVRPQPGLQLSR